jgi:MFS family permease
VGGIFLLPLTAGFLVARPVSGYLSDRFGARGFASGGMGLFAASFIGLLLLPVDFPYWQFALLVLLNGIGSGMFAAPNTSAIMSAVPANQRGSASGMRSTFQNAGMSVSIGVFFSLLITGLHAKLPQTFSRGLEAHGVSQPIAAHVASLPPVATVFAAFLGYNPIQNLLKPFGILSKLPPTSVATLTGKRFFPKLISAPFHRGLVIVFAAAATMAVVAAVVSLMRGGRYYHADTTNSAGTADLRDADPIPPNRTIGTISQGGKTP